MKLFSTSSAASFFFAPHLLDQAITHHGVQKALAGCDDGELYLEYTLSESLSLDDQRIKSARCDIDHGFGLRAVVEDRQSYAFSNDFSTASLDKAVAAVQAVRRGYSGTLALPPPVRSSAAKFYPETNPFSTFTTEDKVQLLTAIDHYARQKDPCIQQVSVAFGGKWQVVMILRADGFVTHDVRPIVALRVSIVTQKGDRLESGRGGGGWRGGYDLFFDPSTWQGYVDEALRQSLVNQEAIPAPAGVMPVVLAGGEPGTLLHEAVGHGLEGDFNRKKLSVFSGRIGQQVAAKGVTVVDDGTLSDRRGSLHTDDEGTPTQRNVLIEDGMLKGYMQDRLSARLMGVAPTGNGRRESYSYLPMPRMTNTFMTAGSYDPQEIIKSVKKGLYAVDFSGGQVDIVNGNFVFSATEAYLIENGQITAPVKGATLVGNGPEVMTKVTMVGNDLTLDPGQGMCGKNGQSVPVSVGQPTLLVGAMTVGGTQA